MGSLEPYKFLPIPSVDLFIQTMKLLNIKIYDDVILYSQIPENIEELTHNYEKYAHLIGVFRA